MSTTTERMPLAIAEARARDIMARIGIPEMSVTGVVGSIRRRKADVGDIEFLLPTAPAASPRDAIFDLIDAQVIKGDCMFSPSTAFLVPQKGHKPFFKSASYTVTFENPTSTVAVEFYRHTPANRGWMLLMRTGPGEFGEWFLARWKKAHDIGGDRPASVEGHLVDRWGKVIPVETEEQCFAHIKCNVIPPEKREAFVGSLRERSRT